MYSNENKANEPSMKVLENVLSPSGGGEFRTLHILRF